MIPMAYLDADISRHVGINPSEKSGESTNKNHYTKSRNSAKSLKKMDIGPAVILCLGEREYDYTLGYDQFGKPKKI